MVLHLLKGDDTPWWCLLVIVGNLSLLTSLLSITSSVLGTFLKWGKWTKHSIGFLSSLPKSLGSCWAVPALLGYSGRAPSFSLALTPKISCLFDTTDFLIGFWDEKGYTLKSRCPLMPLSCFQFARGFFLFWQIIAFFGILQCMVSLSVEKAIIVNFYMKYWNIIKQLKILTGIDYSKKKLFKTFIPDMFVYIHWVER